MPEAESIFQKMIDDTSFISNKNYGGFYDPLSKYTIELLYDGHKLPDKYVTIKNTIIYGWPKVMKRLVTRGDLSIIKKIWKFHNDPKYIYHVASYAAKVGNINILGWAVSEQELDSVYYPDITLSAVLGNQLESLKWLVNHNIKINNVAVYFAAKKGLTDVFKFVFEQNRRAEAFGYYAALSGQDDIIKFLHADPKKLSGVGEGALQIGNFDLFKFAYDNGYFNNISQHLENNIIFPCHNIKILRWLISNNYMFADFKTSLSVVCGGNLECLQFLHSINFLVLDIRLFEQAAHNCDIVAIKFLHGLNCPIDKLAINKFVSGFLDRTNKSIKLPRKDIEFWKAIKVLEEYGCIWDDVCFIAATYGNLEILKYAYERGCPLTIEVMNAAATNGYLNIIIWLREHGCEWNELTCSACVRFRQTNILKWLRDINNFRSSCSLASNETELCPWNVETCYRAMEYGYLDVLKFAIENGCEHHGAIHNVAVGLGLSDDIKNYIVSLSQQKMVKQ